MSLSRYFNLLIFIIATTLISSAYASAQVSEIRIGISEFDERTFSLPAASQIANENSIGISGEILFESPDILSWALSPQPYIGGTINLGGNTSFAGGGVLWRKPFGEKFYGDFAIGLVVHTGTTEVDFPDSDFEGLSPEEAQNVLNAAFADVDFRLQNEIQFGSRVLFRPQVALGYNINDDWAGEFYIEHLSNGFIFSSTNEGVNILGVRGVRKF